MTIAHEQLLKSAKFFTAESVRNAIQANAGDSQRWQLAVFHIVTALEHTVKAMLASRSPVFIRERFENTEKSVSLASAFERLKDPEIYDLNLNESDAKRVRAAIKIRNEIAHGFVSENPQAVAARFFEVFGLIRELFRFHLKTQIHEFLNQEEMFGILSISRQTTELEKRAINALQDHDMGWFCSSCGKDFFIHTDDGFFCLFCHHEEPTWECERCAELMPEHEALETSELFLYEFSEGLAELVSNFGIEEKKVCFNCYKEIEQEANEAAREEEYYSLEEEYSNYMADRLARDPY